MTVKISANGFQSICMEMELLSKCCFFVNLGTFVLTNKIS